MLIPMNPSSESSNLGVVLDAPSIAIIALHCPGVVQEPAEDLKGLIRCLGGSPFHGTLLSVICSLDL